MLLMVADRLQSLIRKEDTACRWGGDEFVCLLLEIKQEANGQIMKKLIIVLLCIAVVPLASAEALKIYHIDVEVCIYPVDGNDVDELMKAADAAMYKAKGTKNRVRLFRESSLTNP